MNPAGDCFGVHGNAARQGVEYEELITMTRGTASNICDGDWDPIFDAIVANIVSRAALPCDYLVPNIGAGALIDYAQVDVTINGVALSAHESPAGCESAPGWYFDEPAELTTVHICPAFCGDGFGDDLIEVVFHCVKF